MSRIIVFIQSFFRRIFRRDPAQEFVPIPRQPFAGVPVAASPPAVATKPPAKKRAKSDVPETLSELLDNLQITFDALRLPDVSFIDKADRKALRSLGVHIPSPWRFKWDEDDSRLTVDTSKPMPSIMCVSIPDGRKEHGFMFPKFMFAIKLPGLPARVAKKSGIPYIFGYALTSQDRGLKNDLLWGKCFITINRTSGVISFCDEFQFRDVVVPLKNPLDRKRFGPFRKIVSRGWDKPMLFADMVDPITHENADYEVTKRAEKNCICNMFEIWRSRESRWSVAVQHGKDRVTFGIAPENTKKYFADRDKTIKAKDGRAKRIIHYVRPHTRTYPSGKVAQVKEHIRGICFFNWKGYDCSVTAPKFNGIVTALFDADPKWSDGEIVPPKMIDSSELGKMLANAEIPQVRH